MSQKTEHNNVSKKQPVAIIGMSGVFPESDSIEQFWEKLENQDQLIKVIPDDHDPKRTIQAKRGAFVKNLQGFDAKLFHIIGKEAKYMTPQQRKLLQSVWHLFEDACILPASLKDKKVAVIVGKEVNPYMEYLTKAPITAYSCLGMAQTYLPNRISNYFNLKGPSYCINTSCSSGLTALHHGKKMLQSGEVDYAIVAGVSLIYGEEWTRSFFGGSQSMGLMSTTEDGGSPFQDNASGFTPSEGVVSLLLKRNEEAVNDNDNIHALVIGSESSHVGGSGNIAFPDSGQQSKAIVAAYKEADIDPKTVTHIEAHAAAAILADSQEIRAFKLADKHFGKALNDANTPPCKISSLKPNIGHMHAASGLASVIRLVNSFKAQKKLGIKDFKTLSPEIKLDKTRYYMSAETENWPRLIDDNKKEIPRRGAVNNSGGGGNVIHTILEEYIPKETNKKAEDLKETAYFLALSSVEVSQFVPYAERIKTFLTKHKDCNPKQLEYQYLKSRKELSQRIVFRYKTIEDLVEKLNKFIVSEGKRGYYVNGNHKKDLSLNEIFLKNGKVVEFLNELSDSKDKSFLFDLWAKGYETPIHKYFENIEVPKLSLPGYPFNEQNYWLDIYADKTASTTEAISKENSTEKTIVTANEIQSNATNTSIGKTVSEVINVEKKVEQFLLKTVSELLDVSVTNISTEEEIGDYGFNSVGLTEFANVLSEFYAIKVLPTLFYNYPTIQKLTTFLVEEHKEALAKQHQVAIPVAAEQRNEVPVLVSETKKGAKKCKSEGCAVKALANKANEPIAIIGMSGRFPGSPDVNTFWENIKANKDLVTEIPKDRWDWQEYYGDTAEDKQKTTAKWGGFIDDIDKFDPLHFSISPKEAELMDPQHRLAIEEAYHALEDAGVNPKSLSGTNTGVFVGSYFDDYATLIDRSRITDSQVITGLSQSMVANRISYLLDLHGPSETIDTACSSSLVAIKRGIEKIQKGDCDVVLAGGVSLVLMPDLLFPLSQAGFLSKEGRCKTFDQSANGYVRGEGVGMIVLKRLSQAKADGDRVHAVIRGASENHGGKANTLTSPNPNAQKDLLIKAYKSANVNPEQVGYIEAHGTGTPLGDPIETEGLKLAFKALYKDADKAFPILPHIKLGSVKTNIGHLEPAAGIAGIIKLIHVLKHKTIPGNPHLKQPNAYLDLENSPFELQKETTPWFTTKGQTRVAGISSFGAGGSNAHVVLEEYVTEEKTYLNNEPTLVVISAKNKKRLKDQVQNLLQYVKANNTANIYDIAYTLQVGREALEERLAVSVLTIAALQKTLEDYLNGNETNILLGNTRKNKTTANNQESEIPLNGIGFKTLAEYWIKGVAIDWKQLYRKDNCPNIISLPTYAFARQRYWIPKTTFKVVEQPTVIEADETPEKVIQLYKENWKPVTIETNSKIEGLVLILNASEAHKTIVEALKKQINETLVVNPSEIDTITYKKVRAVIDFGSKSMEDYTWVEVIQKVIDQSNEPTINLVQLCRTNQTIIGKGLYQTLGAEYSKVSSVSLELDTNATTEADVNAILQTLTTTTNNVRLQYTNKQWKAPYLDSLALKAEAKIEGPIVITGGTRGLGMAYAKHLVTKHNVKQLVLLGRQEFPPRQAWESIAKENTILAQKIKDVLYLENCGAEVKLIQPNLVNIKEVALALDKIKKQWGAIKGLVHCAGLVDMETPAFIRKSIETITKLQAPKVLGLHNLYDALKEHDVDFGILFSSISALAPHLGAGQCDYAMCNAYLENFAALHYKEGYRSIQWPSWKETGMGEVTEGIYRDLGLLSLTNAEGATIIDKVIALKPEHGLPTIAPMVYNPNVFSVETLLQIPEQKAQAKVEVTKADDSVVSNWVTVQISEALKLPSDSIEIDIPFQEYGVDSILLADLVKQLEKELGGNVSLSPSIILEHPTVGMLSEYLAEHHNDALSQILNQKLDSEIKETEPTNITNTVIEEVEQEQKTIPSQNGNTNEPIAIIGMACHFPDADTIGDYWDNLKQGKDSIKEVPANRWDINKHYSPNKEQGKSYSKWGGFLDTIEDFDPAYFKVPEALASQLDPLERQWLEVSAEAIEDAGYDKKGIWGKSVGVYAGARVGNFKSKLSNLHKDFIVGTGQNFITAHLAHIYNLKGPNMVVDTACSSSLTAMDLAVKGLRQGETELALAGGVDILLDEGHFVGLSIAEVLSKDGRTKAFDEKADGTGLGEGCGILVLKRLSDAIADGDKIYSVIEGTAVNNDGSTMGITTPNPKAQQELLEIAIKNGQIDRSTISYIEAHGTGTLIGDPIELKGITSVLSKSSNPNQKCAVGSVKTNIGHLMSAAGVAGVIKTALAISAKQLPPTLNCDTPNPRFDFANSPVYPVRTLQDWEGVNNIRRAGISAFGLGGNNAHVILSNEGIPEANRINTPFTKTTIAFNKKRYWPEAKPEIKSENTKVETTKPEVNKTVSPAVTKTTINDVSAESMAAYFNMKKEKQGNDWTFTLDMNNDHYVLRDHRVHGVSIVPGVTYLDLILRCSKVLFGKTFEISRIIFIEPLATDQTYNRRVEVRFKKGTHAISEAMVRSRRVDHNGNVYGKWDKHVQCRLNNMPTETRETFNIEAFKTNCERQLNMADVYKSARTVDIVHGEFMETLGMVYQKGREELMQLHLSDLSTSYLDRFYLSPAFLDGATFSGSSFHAISKNQVSYIPFSIEQFRAYNTLPSTIYVYSKHKEEKFDTPSEVIKSDISIYDANGTLLVEFKNLAIKRIRHAGLITNLLQENNDKVLQA